MKAFLLALLISLTALAERPNFVVIFTDDQGYGDLSCFGATHVNTPHIDRLAREGTKLTSFYVAAPVCTPSRAALMTGCYPKRVNMATGSDFVVVLAGDPKGLHPNEITIAEVLKTRGYATGIFGKWHLGDQPDFLPTRQGFDEFFGVPYSHDIHPFHPRQNRFKFTPLPLLDGEKVIESDPDADYLTKRITDRAVKFIERNTEKPFFLYIPHPIPHVPLHVSPPYMKNVSQALKLKLADEKEGTVDYRTRNGLFRQAITEIDDSVGRIVDTLKKYKLDDNTLVIFTSDNGPAVGKAGPLRGKKGSAFEGGMREATVAWWPGKIPANHESAELVTAMDLLPTFAILAGAQAPTDREIDGKDISNVLLNRQGKSPHDRFFYHQANNLRAVRAGKWKLYVGPIGKRGEQKVQTTLFNLNADIGEKINRAAQHPHVVKRLRGYMNAFETELGKGNNLTKNCRPAGFVKNAKPLVPAR
ncbi:MAG: arylsulfatase [Verrucomicrobiales bacterium]|nr:arylsulfatase [Verrucomicrobiales bacterium]|tara:strand:+ start:5539 stop:6960 length:1422 start_codon:yes stop_codon:yes gene_type:complete